MKAQVGGAGPVFVTADELFGQLKAELRGEACRQMTHDQVEEKLVQVGAEIMRRLFQGYLDLRGAEEPEAVPVGADGVTRNHRRWDTRVLMSVFGEVAVGRTRYSTRGQPSVVPLDAALNLPLGKPSYGVQQRLVQEVVKGSFEEAVAAVERTSAARVGKLQGELVSRQAAIDFDAFYAQRTRSDGPGEILVITVDGKGVVMRPECLRPATQQAARRQHRKRQHRLSKGEKRASRRMAEVAAVYTLARKSRSASDIVGELAGTVRPPGPKPEGKRVWASLSQAGSTVVGAAFDEAERRDPQHRKRWVALVDGCAHQIAWLTAEARARRIELSIVVDVIHVIEYLWKAAHALFAETDLAAEAWVTERLRRVLSGRASTVASGIRRSATLRGLSAEQRRPMDRCAAFLLNHKLYLAYDEALAAGFPIATGVIEGTCRHLVKDRMDITGARWSVAGAEAVLRLRALKISGDFDAYWQFHLDQEHRRNHLAHFAQARPPRLRSAAPHYPQHLSLPMAA